MGTSLTPESTTTTTTASKRVAIMFAAASKSFSFVRSNNGVSGGSGVGSSRSALRSIPARRRACGVVTVKAAKPPQVNRTTGFIESDNTGMGNIFAIEPKQLYTESPTSDKYAKTGLGGIVGVVLTLGILAGVFIGVKTLGSFEASNNEFVGYAGESVSHYAQKFSYTTSATTTDESTPPVVASDDSEAPPSIAENFN